MRPLFLVVSLLTTHAWTKGEQLNIDDKYAVRSCPNFRSPTFLSLKYDPDVDSKAGVQCVGGEWDTSDMPSTEDCNDDVRIQPFWNSRAFLEVFSSRWCAW